VSSRRPANDSASIQVRKVKEQILSGTGLKAPNLSLDQLVRLADKEGFTVVVSCVRINRD